MGVSVGVCVGVGLGVGVPVGLGLSVGFGVGVLSRLSTLPPGVPGATPTQASRNVSAANDAPTNVANFKKSLLLIWCSLACSSLIMYIMGCCTPLVKLYQSAYFYQIRKKTINARRVLTMFVWARALRPPTPIAPKGHPVKSGIRQKSYQRNKPALTLVQAGLFLFSQSNRVWRG